MPEPWEIEATLFEEATGVSPQEALDQVIVQWLGKGNTRPLACSLILGHVPAEWVLRYVGLMLDAEPDEDVPYRLDAISRSGKRGNAKHPENFIRDLMAATTVKLMMEQGVKYEPAIAKVASEKGVSEATLEKAYTRWYGRDAHRRQWGD